MTTLAGAPLGTAADASSPRSRNLDALKGLAIALVALGHSVQAAYADFDSQPAFRLIYSFHMPLFMFLSGLAAAYSRNLTSLRSLRGRGSMLLLPFAGWAVVSFVYWRRWGSESVTRYVRDLVRSPDNGLWFLWVLFLAYVCLACALLLRRWVGPVAFVVVALAVHEFPKDAFGLQLLKWHVVFFFAGFLCRNAPVRWRLWWGLVPVALFVPVGLTWRRTQPPSNADHLRALLHGRGGARAASFVLEAYNYLIPFLGIIACFTVVGLLARFVPRAVQPLVALAPFTLDIYAIHFYFLRWPHQGAGVLLQAVIAIAGALVVSIIFLRRSQVLSRLLLGGRPAGSVSRARSRAKSFGACDAATPRTLVGCRRTNRAAPLAVTRATPRRP